jgi:precorrin-2 dehydrogenase/sirohydrochlorin ferrochelatase
MTYLPIFFSLENKKVLLVGAGNVASKRLEKLLDFTTNITIISDKISDDILEKVSKNNLDLINRRDQEGDIRGFDIVIVATDNIKLQEDIYFESRKENILYNCVDLQEYCDFIFPSYIKDGDLTIAISTNGSSPAFTKKFKEYLKKIIPNDIAKFLDEMKNLRQSMPKGKERMNYLEEKTKEYLEKWN